MHRYFLAFSVLCCVSVLWFPFRFCSALASCFFYGRLGLFPLGSSGFSITDSYISTNEAGASDFTAFIHHSSSLRNPQPRHPRLIPGASRRPLRGLWDKYRVEAGLPTEKQTCALLFFLFCAIFFGIRWGHWVFGIGFWVWGLGGEGCGNTGKESRRVAGRLDLGGWSTLPLDSTTT